VLNGSRWFSSLPVAMAAMDSAVDGYVVYNACVLLTYLALLLTLSRHV